LFPTVLPRDVSIFSAFEANKSAHREKDEGPLSQ
jgi:hypothetical protein